MPANSGQPDRRNEERLTERCRVTFRTLSEGRAGAKVTAGETVNLSGSGVCFLANESVPRDTQLALEFRLEGRAEPVLAMGTVVWCAPSGSAHKLGVSFSWVRAEDQKALAVIADFVRDRLER